jgi:hypothetical protein
MKEKGKRKLRATLKKTLADLKKKLVQSFQQNPVFRGLRLTFAANRFQCVELQPAGLQAGEFAKTEKEGAADLRRQPLRLMRETS